MPGLANKYFPGSATANYYDLLWSQMGGSDADATHNVDRVKSAKFPNCIIKTGCYTLFADAVERHVDVDQRRLLELPRRHDVAAQGLHARASRSTSTTRCRTRQDNGGAPESGGGIGGGIMLDPYDWDAFYGDSDFDVRHNLNSNVLFELPFGQGKKFLEQRRRAGRCARRRLAARAASSGIARVCRLRSPTAASGSTNWSFIGLADPHRRLTTHRCR